MTAAADDPPDKDQSMDDILASIRRIMLDEQARLQDGPGPGGKTAKRAQDASTDPVLILDSSMVVADLPPESLGVSLAEETVIMVSSEHAHVPPHETQAEPILDTRDLIATRPAPTDAETGDADLPVASEPEHSAHTTVLGASGVVPAGETLVLDPGPRQVVISAQAIEALMAPAAAAAAAASVETLLKQLSEERRSALQPSSSSSPTIEDVVRAELRPFLKAWLDDNLPPMVERLVRDEITRLIGRSGF